MAVQVHEIYTVRLPWRRSNDLRPCIVLSPPIERMVTVALISAQPDLYDANFHFWIDETHPNFPDTGLDRRSYIAGNEIHEIKTHELRRRLGCLSRDLKEQFLEWFGE